MPEPAYPAARAVASSIEAHFLRHRATAEAAGRVDLAPPPDSASIETIVDAAFWASLRREEGVTPKISLAFTPPALSQLPLLFSHALPLYAAALAKLAPAVERPGIHLGVRPGPDGLVVWGMTRVIPPYCLVLEVVAPGLLVVKHRRHELGKFVNVAVLEGDRVKVLDQRTTSAPDCPRLVTALFGSEPDSAAGEPVDLLVQLAVSMRTHGRGGSLLVVPGGADAWLASIVRPIAYSVRPAFSELAQLMRAEASERAEPAWQESLGLAVNAIAGLTAVDGATVISDRYDLLAFGAKISRREGCPQVERVLLTEPIEGVSPSVEHPAQLGGTRHLSAAQFVQDQHDALALVASQDGRFTVFAWSGCENVVHAHRVEALLL
jgi:hypothetical protein